MLVRVTTMRVRLTPPIEWKFIDRPFAPGTPEVLLEVSETDTFSDLVDRALEVLDPDATVVPFWGSYEGGPPPSRATLFRLGPAGLADLTSEAVYKHEDPWYAVRDDGTVYRVEAHYPRPVPVVDLLRATESGYSDRDFLDVLLSEHHGGYGGGGEAVPFWIDLLGQVGVGVAGGAVWSGLVQTSRGLLLSVRGLRLRHVDRITRDAARRWEENGFDYASALREFFDRKATWHDTEVAKRLGVSISTGRQLLFALGHDPEVGSPRWTRTDTSSARRRRRHWLKKEFRQTAGPHWRRHWKSSGYSDL